MENINRPSQHAAKQLLFDSLNHGDKEALAHLCDVSPSLISQQCNPDESKPSWYGRFKLFLWAVSHINPDAAQTIKSDMDASFEAWTTKPVEDLSRADWMDEVAATSKETSDAIIAACHRKSPAEIAKECDEAIAQLQRLRSVAHAQADKPVKALRSA
jgi:hypothetical protein